MNTNCIACRGKSSHICVYLYCDAATLTLSHFEANTGLPMPDPQPEITAVKIERDVMITRRNAACAFGTFLGFALKTVI